MGKENFFSAFIIPDIRQVKQGRRKIYRLFVFCNLSVFNMHFFQNNGNFAKEALYAKKTI